MVVVKKQQINLQNNYGPKIAAIVDIMVPRSDGSVRRAFYSVLYITYIRLAVY